MAEKTVGEPYTGNLYVRFDEGRGQPPRLLYWSKIPLHVLFVPFALFVVSLVVS